MQKLQEQIPVKTKSCAVIAVIHELSGLEFHKRYGKGSEVKYLALTRPQCAVAIILNTGEMHSQRRLYFDLGAVPDNT